MNFPPSLISLGKLRQPRRATPSPTFVSRADSFRAVPPVPLPADLKQRLAFVRRRHRTIFVGMGLFKLLGAASLLLLAQGLADEGFDLPWLARAIFLLIDAILLGLIYVRHLHPFLAQKMDGKKAALLIEKKWPGLNQTLVTAVELSEGNARATRGSPQLLNILLQQARAQTARLNFREVVPLAPLRRWALLGGTALLGTLALAAAAWPSSGILAERLFLLNVPRPTQTIVTPISRDMAIPLGSDVELVAQASGVIPAHGRVTVIHEGQPPEDFPLNVERDKPGFFSLTVRNVQKSFKYTFSLNDGRGPEFTVTARVPPAVAGLTCAEVYPEYTKLPPQPVLPTNLSLLAGSHLHLSATASVPLKSASVLLQGGDRAIAMTLDPTKTRLEADIPIPAKDLTGLSLHLVDEAGVNSANDAVYAVEIVPDKPPVIKIGQSAGGTESITLRAKPVIAFDASDDYGLTQLSLNYQAVPPAIAGQDSEPSPEIHRIPIPIQAGPQATHGEYTLDVAAQIPAWQEGWTVDYWIEAVDNNTATGPGITRTDHRQLEIVSAEAKQAEILSRLKEDAADINTLSDRQEKASRDLRESVPDK